MAARPTLKGDRLAARLAEHIGMTHQIRCTCAQIVMHARRFGRYELVGINGAPHRAMATYGMERSSLAMLDAAAAAYEERAEQGSDEAMDRILDLVQDLPDHDEGYWVVRYSMGRVWLIGPGRTEILVEV